MSGSAEGVLAIEIGGTKLQLVLGDNGEVLEHRRLEVDSRNGAEGIRQQIQGTISDLRTRYRLKAIGVGFGGPVDWRTGKICRSHQIEGWSEFDLAGWLEGLGQCPVRVDNDANVAALGEALHGAGKGFDPVFYVTLGSGVGGGLVLDGKIYHGMTPGEAEIGHVRLDRTGTTVESRCSGWAVDARVRELKRTAPNSLLASRITGEAGGEARLLAEALKDGDAAAQGILAEVCEDLAFALSHVTHLFHPQVIILGGGLSKIGEPLRSGVGKALPRFVMEAFLPAPEIVLAGLGENAVPDGALALAVAAGK